MDLQEEITEIHINVKMECDEYLNQALSHKFKEFLRLAVAHN